MRQALALFVTLPICVAPAWAFEEAGAGSPDSYSMHVTPGKIQQSWDGFSLGDDKTGYMTLTTRYRFRDADAGDDEDIYQYLRFHTDDIEAGDGTIKFGLFGRYADDLNSSSDRSTNNKEFYYWGDILDAEMDGDSSATRLYRGYIQAVDVIPNSDVTLGRFHLAHQNTFQMDGVDVKTSIGDSAEVYVYGGTPVSYFRDDADDDKLYGGGVSVQAAADTKVGVEYAYFDIEELDNDYVKLRVDQSIDNGNLALSYTRLNDVGTVNAYGTYELVSTGTIVDVEYEGLLDASDSDSEGNYLVNPMTKTLLREEKYHNLTLSVYQAVGDHLSFGLSYTGNDTDKVGDFNNRDYGHYKGMVSIYGLPTESTYLTVGAEKWDVQSTNETNDEDNVALTFKLTQGIGETMEVWLGSSFNRFSYDYINDRREDSVKSYYIGGQVQPAEFISLLADISLEDTEVYDNVLDGDFDKNYRVNLWANFVF